MMHNLPINGRDDVKRDPRTGAVLSCDRGKLMEAKRLKKENERYINLEKRVQELENIVRELLKGK
jgi:hypothetical protein